MRDDRIIQQQPMAVVDYYSDGWRGCRSWSWGGGMACMAWKKYGVYENTVPKVKNDKPSY